MKEQTITAIIIAKDESEMIANCIDTLRWCDEVLVIDNGSDDDTAQLAEKLGARVVSFASKSFAQLRNKAIKYVKTEWMFYVDADERVTPTLSKEILVHLETESGVALRMKRHNFFYGIDMHHGGWQDDYVTRVFKVKQFTGWYGDIHESPRYEGNIVDLHSPLLHLSHRSTADNLVKSAQWTPMEAELLFKSGIKPVTLFTLIRKGVMEVFRRAIVKGGRKDGMAGWVEAIVQGMNRVMVYIQVWELQQKPGLIDRYKEKEVEIVEMWKKEK